MALQVTIAYDTALQFTYDTSKVEISGSTIRLKDLGGGTYSTSGELITSQFRIPVTAFSGISASASIPSQTAVRYQLELNGVVCWWNTSSLLWEAVPEDGDPIDYSNTSSEINSEAPDLFSDLALSGSAWFRLRVVLVSGAGTARPTLTSNALSFDQHEPTPDTISECLVFAYLSDLLGNSFTYDATKLAYLTVKNGRAFGHGNKVIQPFKRSAAFNSSGYAEVSVIETNTPQEKLQFTITYYEGPTIKTVRFTPVVVPESASVALTELTSVVDEDFG